MLYSLATREQGVFHILEYSMNIIVIENIRNISFYKNAVHFEDGIHQYKLNTSEGE